MAEIRVTVPGRGILTFPDGTSDEDIDKAVELEFPVDGQMITERLAENPAYAKDMTRDEFLLMRKYKEDNPVSFGSKVAAGVAGIGDVVGKAFTTPPEFQQGAGPLEKANSLVANVGQAALVGYGDFSSLFLSALENYDADNNSYEKFLSTRKLKDSPDTKAQYEKVVDDELNNFRSLQNWQEQRKNILAQSSMPNAAEAGSFLIQPPLPIAAGMEMLGVGGKIGAATARAAQATGRAIRGAGELTTEVASIPQRIAASTAEAITGNADVAQRVEQAVTRGTTGLAAGQLGLGLTVPGLSTTATAIAGTKLAGRSLSLAGELMEKVAEHAAKGEGRIGVFEGLAKDLSASTAARTIGRIGSVAGADVVAPYLAAATRGVAEGAVVGGLLGYMADGEDGAAGGIGAGLTLGAAGGVAGRAYMHGKGYVRQQRILNDAVRSTATMDAPTRANAAALFDRMARDGHHEAVAEIVDVRNWLSGDVEFRFVNDAEAKAMPEARGVAFEGVTVVPAGKGAKPSIIFNVDAVKPGTGFHESFHGAMRTALGETIGKRIFDGVDSTFTPAQKAKFYDDYVNRGRTEPAKQELRDYLNDGNNLVEEMGAEYFREFLQRRENRDLLLRGERTSDGAVIGKLKGGIDFVLRRMGVDGYKANTGHPALDALARELIVARTDINKAIAKNGRPLAEVPLARMPTPALVDWANDEGQGDVLLRDAATGDVIGVRTEEQVNVARDAAYQRSAEELASVPRGVNNVTDAELAVYNKHLAPEHFNKLVFLNEAQKSGNIINSTYFPATKKAGEGTLYASRGSTNRDIVVHKIRTTQKGAVAIEFLDVTQLRSRFDDVMSRPGVLERWGGNKDAAWTELIDYSRNLSLGDGVAKPSAELFGPIKRDIFNKIYGFAPTKAQLQGGEIRNISSLGINTRSESGTGKQQIGKPAYQDSKDTRVVSTMRLDRLGKLVDLKQNFPFNESGSYKLSQVNFKPAEVLPHGKVYQSDEGFRIIERKNRFSLFDPNGERVGIYSNAAEASAKAQKVNFKPADEQSNQVAEALPRRNLSEPNGVTRDEKGNITFRGKEPKDWTPEDFADYGKAFGVDNLGPLSPVREIATELPGSYARLPGGLDGKFTYYDLLWLKANPVDVKTLPEKTHAQLTAKLARTMEPAPGDQISSFNSIVFGMLSPNAPLLPNEIGQARMRFGSMDEIRRFAKLYPENPTKENLVKLNEQLKKELGFIAAGKGGLGIPITADLSNIVNAARMFVKNPDFFVKQPGESWANFVDKLTTQVSGFGTKTGSFGSVWQDPLNASISAMDRHMARTFGQELLGDKDLRSRFEGIVVDRFNALIKEAKKTAVSYEKKIARATETKSREKLIKERDKDLAKLPDPTAVKAKTLDDVLGQAEIFGADRVREFVNEAVFAAMGSRKAKLITAKGDINPNAPEHIKAVEWIETPNDFQVMSEAYRSALEINQKRAEELGVAVFPAQWTLWDRIRQRVEPHEAMFPGLEKLPALNDRQLAQAYAANKVAGYMSTPKPGKKWKRAEVESPSSLAYFMPDTQYGIPVNITPDQAKARGLAGPFYHGSPDFKGDKFDPELRARNTGISRGGFSFTDDFNAANSYARGGVDSSQAAVDSANKVMRELAQRIEKGLKVDGFTTIDDVPEFNSRHVDDISELASYFDEIAEKIPRDLGERLRAASRAINQPANPVVVEAYLKDPTVQEIAGKKLFVAKNPDDIFVASVQRPKSVNFMPDSGNGLAGMESVVADMGGPVWRDALAQYGSKAAGYRSGGTRGMDRELRRGEGKKLWEDMTERERIAEFREAALNDLRVAKQEATDTTDYMLNRALDPLDPMGGLYKALLQRAGAELKDGRIRVPANVRTSLDGGAPKINFQPEAMPNGTVYRADFGYTVVNKNGGKFRVFSPVGELIAVAKSLEEAERLIAKRL